MAWRFTGRARVDPRAPQAFGVCDRCGFWYNLHKLAYQFEWRGLRLQNIRQRVCPKCMDRPFIFNRPLVLPPDPVPKSDPRPQNFQVADQGSPVTPPLPWPTQPLGAPPTTPIPAIGPYVTPPLPPLPASIAAPYPTFSEE